MEYDFKSFDKVLVRDHPSQIWRADMFSNKGTDIYVCVGNIWAQCIPYEGNEHLLGTTKDPASPEPDFNLGDKVKVRNYPTQQWIKAIFTGYDPRYVNKKFYLAVSEYDVTTVTCWEQCRHADW